MADVIKQFVTFSADSMFIFSRVSMCVLAVILSVLVIGYSPFKISVDIFSRKKLGDRISSVVLLVLILLSYNVFFSYWLVKFHPDLVLSKYWEFFVLIKKPLIGIPLFLFSQIMIVFGEELVFRYYGINCLKAIMPNWAVIIFMSLSWALLHKGFSPNIIIDGILLSYIYIRTNLLLLTVFLHLIVVLGAYTEALYVYLTNSNIINFSPFVYALGLLFFFCFLFFVFSNAVINFKREKIA